MYILVWCVILDRRIELDWYLACTGLVCCMYWTGLLDWCIRIFKSRCVVCTVVCTGLVC